MAFEVEQGAYAGPFPVLLELLEKKELTISDVALARIADDFGRYLETHAVPSEELADFLLVASKLIYLKTKELLPYLVVPEEEGEGVSLVDQMRLYQHFVAYAEQLGERHGSGAAVYARPFDKRLVELVIPPTRLALNEMHASFASLLKRNEPFFLLRQASMERVESVKERIQRLTDVIQTRARLGFKEITSGATSRADVIVSFLALLELLKSRIVRATQGEDHDIIIERI
jgi:segregation and condensation protein A